MDHINREATRVDPRTNVELPMDAPRHAQHVQHAPPVRTPRVYMCPGFCGSCAKKKTKNDADLARVLPRPCKVLPSRCTRTLPGPPGGGSGLSELGE